jgi:hypothetical protein
MSAGEGECTATGSATAAVGVVGVVGVVSDAGVRGLGPPAAQETTTEATTSAAPQAIAAVVAFAARRIIAYPKRPAKATLQRIDRIQRLGNPS